ncbi:MAG: 50S ribosomal protein L32 [Chloroflexi bacterium]|nr:50S ribosomal protein L32 [Chloroflexota bacterium]
MPPLPKRKYPSSRQGKRRSHLTIQMPHVVECPSCRAPQLAHTACPVCGKYRGREVLNIKIDELES